MPTPSGPIPPRLMELILHNVADGVFTVDPEFRITYFNRAAERITGHASETVKGQRCCEVFRSPLCETDCPLRRSVRTGQTVENVEIEVQHNDQRRLLISVSTAPLVDPGGRFLGGVETFRDLTSLLTLRKQLNAAQTLGDMASRNLVMQRLFEALPIVARTLQPVLIQGRTGTGKRRLARAIHAQGPRANGPFVTAQVGVGSEAAVDSELFGHAAGVRRHAPEEQTGKLVLASGGTVYLEDIALLPPRLQRKLLVALRCGQVEPTGLGRPIPMDCRILSGTSADLFALAESGRFVKELAQHLAQVKLTLPDLCQRPEDIPLLSDEALGRLNLRHGRSLRRIAPEALAVLMRYPFPGNLEELNQALEFAYIVARGPDIRAEDLPDYLVRGSPGPGPGPDRLVGLSEPSLGAAQDAERQRLVKCLERHHWSIARAAQDLGVHRTTLWRMTRRLGISRP